MSYSILVVGAGMYVCGRGTEGYGTILPAIFQWQRNHRAGNIYLAGAGSAGIKTAKAKVRELMRNMGIDTAISYFPEGKMRDPKCYLKALKEIPKPACAIIAVPDDLHREVAAATIKAGLHILVAKPLTPTLKEAKELIKMQKKNKVYCAVEFHKRFDYANLKLKDTVAQGLIGDPLYFLVEYSQRKSVPTRHFIKWVRNTNIFQYLGVHYVDIIYFATGAKPKRAMAIGQKNWLVSQRVNAYDSIQAVIEWQSKNGKSFTSCILTNWIDPEKSSAMSDQKIKVIGTRGRFESDQKRRGITIVTDKKGIEEPNPYFCSAYGRYGEVSYHGYGIDSICQFLDDVAEIESGNIGVNDLEGKRPTFKETIVTTAVLEAVNRSLKEGARWVNIEA